MTADEGELATIGGADRPTDELVFGMVGAVGAGVSRTAEIVKSILETDYGYEVRILKISELIQQNAAKVAGITNAREGSDRIKNLQKIGTDLRSKFGDNYLAAKAVEAIGIARKAEGGYTEDTAVPQPISRRQATIIDSLKHSDETRLLRSVYGGMYWQFAIFAPEELREQRLRALRVERVTIADIFDRDDNDPNSHGQQVSKTAYLSDFFVRNDKPNDVSLCDALTRFMEIVFGINVHTPKRHEAGMAAAVSAANKSACLSRQVGASIVSDTGELLAVGWNDVPKHLGGLYSDEMEHNDHRCFQWGGRICHNDAKKDDLYQKIFEKLSSSGLLSADASLGKVTAAVKKTPVKDLIEYSRAIHAEMEAIVSAARTGKSGLIRSTLYTTTYPCHNCARHIVAAGITHVYFIEPYSKSLATELHHDAISHETDDGKVAFLQYEGVGPRVMLKVFQNGRVRKNNGKVLLQDRKVAQPVLPPPMDGFTTHEKRVLEKLEQVERQ